jgi:hypothetical protein
LAKLFESVGVEGFGLGDFVIEGVSVEGFEGLDLLALFGGLISELLGLELGDVLVEHLIFALVVLARLQVVKELTVAHQDTVWVA